jgi:hypothetical protein
VNQSEQSYQAYQELIREVDTLAGRISAYYSRHLVCRSGCSGCCQHHLSVFEVEADAISAAVRSLPGEALERVERQAREVEERELRGVAVACPLLIDDRCSIYASRPLICRTQGLPLLYEAGDGEPEVDFCPLNFTAPAAIDDLDEDHLVPLDPLNLKLALTNLSYCREKGAAQDQVGKRLKMSEIIARSKHR